MEIGYIDTPEEWRDVLVMAYAVAGTLLFLVAMVFTIILGLLSVSTVNRARGLMKEKVAPTLDSVRETSESLRGTVGFIGENAVSPIVKVYGAAAGARRFAGVITRLSRRGE